MSTQRKHKTCQTRYFTETGRDMLHKFEAPAEETHDHGLLVHIEFN